MDIKRIWAFGVMGGVEGPIGACRDGCLGRDAEERTMDVLRVFIRSTSGMVNVIGNDV